MFLFQTFVFLKSDSYLPHYVKGGEEAPSQSQEPRNYDRKTGFLRLPVYTKRYSISNTIIETNKKIIYSRYCLPSMLVNFQSWPFCHLHQKMIILQSTCRHRLSVSWFLNFILVSIWLYIFCSLFLYSPVSE